MARHRPVDPRMVETFWRGVGCEGVTGRELANHTGLDESAISRMRSLRIPTPLDVALHAVGLTGPRPLIAPLAKVGLGITKIGALPGQGFIESSLGIVERSAVLVRAACCAEGVDKEVHQLQALECLDELALLVEQARAALSEQARACP